MRQLNGQRAQEAPLVMLQGEPLFETGELRDYARFVARAVRGRALLAALVGTCFLAAALALVALLPKKFHAEARLLAMPAEGAPGVARGGAGEAVGLAQGAAEAVFTHDRLARLSQRLHLGQRWEATRSTVQRFWLAQPTERDVVDTLAKRLAVTVKGADVTLAFDAPEASLALEVVEAAQAELLDARRAAELEPLEWRAAALEANAAQAQMRVDALVAQLDTAARSRRRGARAATVGALQAEGQYRSLPDASLAALRLQLLARRRAIAELEDAQKKRLAELNATLAEQKAVLAPGNPALADTEDRLRAVQREDASVAALRGEEQRLLAAYVGAGGKAAELAPEPLAPLAPPVEDEPTTYRRARLSMELASLQQQLVAAADARVAVAAAKASFDSRYAVITPAELPRAPLFPKPGLFLAAGLMGGLLLGVLAAVAAQLRGGVIHESWQVQRQLRLKVLALVPEP